MLVCAIYLLSSVALTLQSLSFSLPMHQIYILKHENVAVSAIKWAPISMKQNEFLIWNHSWNHNFSRKHCETFLVHENDRDTIDFNSNTQARAAVELVVRDVFWWISVENEPSNIMKTIINRRNTMFPTPDWNRIRARARVPKMPKEWKWIGAQQIQQIH